MNLISALIVEPDGSARMASLSPDLDSLREAIGGGWLEGITPASGAWLGYVDEEGKIRDLPVNPAGSSFARAIGWANSDTLRGPVVFVGADGESDVPPEVVGEAIRVWDGIAED